MADPSSYGPRPSIIAPSAAVERGVAVVLHASACGTYLAYGNGPSVIIRSIADPSLCFVYSEHSAAVKVAKFSPSGKYVASGDATGKVRVWAFNHPEHVLKYEFPGIGGEVEDLAWDGEGKRIAAVGGGASKAKVFAWDTGSSLAPEVIPHSKKNITVDFKSSRPFKVVWGGEDFNLSLYAGPPFKYERGLKEHSNFVNCVRYAPDGSKFVSVSSDKKGVVYDGTSGDPIGKLDPATMHTGSVYACAWSPDGSKVVTSSADKSVKVWDLLSPGAGGVYPCLSTLSLGSRAEDMQNGVAWPSADTIVSLSLDGTFNYVRVDAGGTGAVLSRSVSGHVAAVCAMDINAATGGLVTGDAAGRVMVWTPRAGAAAGVLDASPAVGELAAKKVAAVCCAGGGLAVASWDDKLRVGDAATGRLTAAISLPGQPKGIAASPAAPEVRVVVTGAHIVVTRGEAIAATLDAPWAPTCAALSEDGTVLAVGGGDKRVRIYSLAGTQLTLRATSAEAGAAISALSVSPDGTKVAAGDALREVRLYAAADAAALVSGRWMAHTTRVTGCRWNPAGSLIATVSSDRRLCVWDPSSDAVKRAFDLAHPHPIAAVAWASDTEVWIAGTDGIVVKKSVV